MKPPSMPVLSTVTPSIGPSTGGVMIELDGQDFVSGATVMVAGVLAAEVTVSSPTHLAALLPPKLGGWGPVPLVVQNPDGQSASRDDLFAYYAGKVLFPGFRFAAENAPASVAVGDVNRDSQLDVVVANSGANSVSVLLGQGGGSFFGAQHFGVGDTPVGIALGDWNGDGNLDIATANNRSDNMSVLLGNGKGSFDAPIDYAIGMRPSAIVAADLNGDRKLDLAVAAELSDFVSVFLNDGAGGFAAVNNIATSGGAEAISTADA